MKPAGIVAVIVVAIAAFTAGIWFGRGGSHSRESSSAEHGMVRYTCPMHPRYISDHEGDCPSCGMRLVPITDEDEHEAMEHETGESFIHINAEKQQRIGVQLAEVKKSAGERILRTVGRVATDETRLYVINATVDGWITSARASSTGSYVKKGEVLATFYSPEFLSASQALLFALDSMDRVQLTGKENPAQQSQLEQFKINLQQYQDSLRNLGMGDAQIARLIKTRQFVENIDITSPANGFILSRKVSEGLRFSKGDEMYQISDLSQVWILVDIFEQEEKYLRPRDRVRVTVPNQGRELVATVSNILPQFDTDSRTLKVRLEAENPGFRLRPNMFVDVMIPARVPPSITVPADAVLDTGLKKRVFVDRGNGYFEPREIETGWRIGDSVQVLNGLVEGERIVISGTFLVDSESRMRASVESASAEHAGAAVSKVKDPVCGMEVDPAQAKNLGRMSEYKGAMYYFCADSCKMQFDKDPAAFLHSK